MSDAAAVLQSDLTPAWGADLQAFICEHCNWRYLLPPAESQKPPRCPHCFEAGLVAAGENLGEMPHPYPPERVAPSTVSEAALQATVAQFAKGIPYAPRDLNYAALRSRLAPLYLPMWLVDARVSAQWQAEAGFNYEVVSHQEHYADSGRGWQTREVREGRIRWENRVGRIRKDCQNVPAPALEEAGALRKQLGDFRLDQTQPYEPRHLGRAGVRLPDRSPQDAWSDAASAFQGWAAREVQNACAANHLRNFRWKADFDALNWTLLLLPAYTTYYLDDQGQPQAVLIHGQTGRIAGKRRASFARAQQTSLIFLIIGLVLAVLGLVAGGVGVVVPVLAPLAFLGLLLGIPTMLAALIPIGIAWDFNRRS